MSIICRVCRSDRIKTVIKENLRYYYCENCRKLYERAFDTQMNRDIIIHTHEGEYHVSAGGLIHRNGKYLLLKRRVYPFGYDFPGGHIEYDEQPIHAFGREILEETGLKVVGAKLLFCDTIKGSKCSYGIDVHIQYFYFANCDTGVAFTNPESESLHWLTLKEMKSLDLVPGAQYIYKKVLTLLS
jgi:ADP-ribose pyrophosphatase YjhB (NUDIX family)